MYDDSLHESNSDFETYCKEKWIVRDILYEGFSRGKRLIKNGHNSSTQILYKKNLLTFQAEIRPYLA